MIEEISKNPFHMGSTELAANLFRATQTDEKLRRERVKGKEAAGNTHYEVGKKVRQRQQETGSNISPQLIVRALLYYFSMPRQERQRQGGMYVASVTKRGNVWSVRYRITDALGKESMKRVSGFRTKA